MTITVENDKVTASGNGTADTFSFSPIVIFTTIVSPDTTFDLEVTTTDSDGVETLRSEGTGATAYAVILTSTTDELSSGSVRFPEAGGTKLASGETITIKRKVSLLQQNDLENQGGYFPDVQENSFDRGMMVAIQQQEAIDRSFKASVGEATLVDLTLPNTSTVSGGQGISLKTDKTGLEYASLTGTLPDPVTVARGGTGAITASDARTNLGVVIGTDVQADLAVPSQAEAEAGTATAERVWTAERVKQANAALPSLGSLRSVQVFTSTGGNTWTRPSGIKTVLVEVQGGGGGGGGKTGTGVSGGAGAGGYVSEIIDVSSTSSTTATVGVGGAGGASGNNNGTVGGTSSFGSFNTAPGGSFSTGTANASRGGGTGGGVGADGDVNITGGSGGDGLTIGEHGGNGGGSFFGSSGHGSFGTGDTAVAKGGGGGGGGGGSDAAGGAGADGIIIVWEYS